MANRITHTSMSMKSAFRRQCGFMTVLLFSVFLSKLASAVVKAENTTAGNNAISATSPLSLPLNSEQQQQPVLNNKHPNYLRIVLLSKIIPYIYWQADAFAANNAPFNLCVVESNGETIAKLWPYINLLNERSSAGRRFQLSATSQFLSQPDSLPKDCHIYYFGMLDQQSLRQLVKRAEHSAILTIGDSLEELKQGAMMAFVEERGKMKIYVNTESVDSSSLKIKSSLLRIAKQL